MCNMSSWNSGCGCGCGNNSGCGCGCRRDICAGERRRAYREGFRNGYWEGFNDASWGRPCGFPQPRGGAAQAPVAVDAGGCGCNN